MTESGMFDLTGRVALVAGGAGYLGRATCKGLAQLGAAVMVADLASEGAQALAEELVAGGAQAAALGLDIAEEASVHSTVARTTSAFGQLDVLVNAAFCSIGKTVDELRAEEFDRANRVNLTGTFLLAREAARAMPRGGSIILFASMYGQVAPDPRIYEPPMNPNPLEYGVGKAGVIQMAKYLGACWGPRGIRVNAIAPGPFPNRAVQQQHPAFIKRLAGKVPMGRIGRQDEIAGTVAFLASNASSYLNGTTISVDGGWTIW